MQALPAQPHRQPEASRQRALWAWGIFAFALLVRGLHLWQIRSAAFFAFRMGDADGYHIWAQKIAGGQWLGSEVFYQAPLYPYFLGGIYTIFGDDVLVVRAVQAVLGAASCGLLTLAGWRWFGKAAGIAAGLMLAACAPALFYDSLIQKSVLDVFFLSLMLWLLSWIVDQPRLGLWAWLGAALGGLILTRENALVFVAAILIWLPIHFRELGRRRLAFAGFFLAGLAAVLLPVATRNAVVGGEFHLTTSSFGPNFYLGNNEKSDGGYVALRPMRGSIEFERIDAVRLAEEAEGRPLTHAEVSRYWTQQALAYIRSHPLDWLRLKGRTLALMYNAVEIVDTEDLYTYAEYSLPMWLAAWVLHFGVLAPLAALGIWITWPQRGRLWLLYLMLAMYTAAVVMFFVFGRYRFPLVPILVLFAAAGVTQFPGFLRSRSAGQIAACFAAVAAMVVFCNWPMTSVAEMKGLTHYNIGAELLAVEKLDEAAVEFRRAIELDKNLAAAHNNLGHVLNLQRQYDKAEVHLRRALSLQNDYAEAYYNLGHVLASLGEPSAAAAQFRKTIEYKPDFAEAYYNLGYVLQQGNAREAEEFYRRAIALDPGYAKALTKLGDLLSMQDEPSEAAAYYKRAMRASPDSKGAPYNLGVLLARQQQWPDAARQFERVIQIDPNFAPAHFSLGNALMQQGKLPQAAARFERALQINPQDTEAKARLQELRTRLQQ